MSERQPDNVEMSGVTCSRLDADRATYSWGEVVVAAVDGSVVTLFDGDTEPTAHCYLISEEAHRVALDHAFSFERARRELAEDGP